MTFRVANYGISVNRDIHQGRPRLHVWRPDPNDVYREHAYVWSFKILWKWYLLVMKYRSTAEAIALMERAARFDDGKWWDSQ